MSQMYYHPGTMTQVYQFRNLHQAPDYVEIPEKPENRTPTDRAFWIAFLVFLVIFLPFAIYTLIHLEPKLIYGADDCGNFCGFKNKKYDEWACTGKDYTDRKYRMLYTDIRSPSREVKQCVSECPSYFEAILNYCQPSTEESSSLSYEDVMGVLGKIGLDVIKGSWAIVVSTVINILLCIGTLYLFRHAVGYLVWFILIGGIVFFFALSGFCWYIFITRDNKKTDDSADTANGAQGGAIFFSVFAIFLLLLVIFMRKRVQLIIQLFKESSKTIFDIPSLVFVPVWTALLSVLVFLIYSVLTTGFAFSAQLVQVAPGYLTYAKNGVMIATIAYSFVIYVWTVKFIAGAQYMVVAGAVSAWFFSRDKHNLGTPLWTSFLNFWKFHKGTVALGSLILTIMDIIRIIIKSMLQNPRLRAVCDCFLSNIEHFLQFLSKNAYIQTAMHGQPLIKSGKRAAKLLMANTANLITLNFIGDFVLTMAQIVLFSVCCCVGFIVAAVTGLTHFWAIGLISTFIAACLVITFFAIFEATIDSMFICFCEDTNLNDGISRPYFMSKGLMKFFEDSKAIVKKTQ